MIDFPLVCYLISAFELRKKHERILCQHLSLSLYPMICSSRSINSVLTRISYGIAYRPNKKYAVLFNLPMSNLKLIWIYEFETFMITNKWHALAKFAKTTVNQKRLALFSQTRKTLQSVECFTSIEQCENFIVIRLIVGKNCIIQFNTVLYCYWIQ